MKTASTVKYSKLSGIYAEYQKYADEYLGLYESYKGEFNSVFRCSNPDSPCCYVVITSNKGMCGAFNNEVLSFFGDIYENGILLTGGGSLLGGLRELIHRTLNVNCVLAKDAVNCVAKGTGLAFQKINHLLDGFEGVTIYKYR